PPVHAHSGQVFHVYNSFYTDGCVIEGGQLIVDPNGETRKTTVSANGLLYISAGGVDSNAILFGGGQEIVRGLQATATSGAPNNYGVETGDCGGGGSSTLVNSGGRQYINTDGFAIGAIVQSGGWQFIQRTVTGMTGGLASATTVSAGGEEDILAGGTASAT